MALGTWFLNRSRKNLVDQNILKGNGTFVIGNDKLLNQNFDFCLAKDKSLLYPKANGDYSILLGGNWRFELIVDSTTGLCQKFQIFLDGIKVIHASLVLPKSKSRDLYYESNEALSPTEGCHYFPFINSAIWDDKNHILCIGNPISDGDAVEFRHKTIAIINNGQLECIYLVLDSIIGNNSEFLN